MKELKIVHKTVESFIEEAEDEVRIAFVERVFSSTDKVPFTIPLLIATFIDKKNRLHILQIPLSNPIPVPFKKDFTQKFKERYQEELSLIKGKLQRRKIEVKEGSFFSDGGEL